MTENSPGPAGSLYFSPLQIQKLSQRNKHGTNSQILINGRGQTRNREQDARAYHYLRVDNFWHVRRQDMNEMGSREKPFALLVPCELAQDIRSDIEKMQLWDSSFRLQKMDNNLIAIPVKTNVGNVEKIKEFWPNFMISQVHLPLSQKEKISHSTPAMQLKTNIQLLMKKCGISETLSHEVPSRWERHGDLVIIPCSSFVSPVWKTVGGALWQHVADSLMCKRLARHAAVADNGFRTSQVELLLGEDGIVTHTDNGIRYTYDVTKCMFSAGNITEKLRVANFQCKEETVVDLYAGIGYFTLPYLVHAQAHHVHACEWNPDAVLALKDNLLKNGVSDKCTVHEGDNRLLQLPPVADRINLGLIPSSEQGWPVAVRVLKPNGGIMHIHGNVTVGHAGKWKHETRGECSKDSDEEHEGGFNVFAESHRGACNENSEFNETEKITKKYTKKHTFEPAGGSVVSNVRFDSSERFDVCDGIEKILDSDDLLDRQTHTKCHSLQNISPKFIHKDGDKASLQNNVTDCALETRPGNVDSRQAGAESSDQMKGHLTKRTEENSMHQESNKKSEKENLKLACRKWSEEIQCKIRSLLERSKGGQWLVQEIHVEVVKSYAPHVVHAVLDLDCRPVVL